VASIEKRDTSQGVRYDVRYRDPSGKQRKRSFKRLDDARKFDRTVEADVLRGDWTDPRDARVTFGDWWERWWATTVNLRPSTRARDLGYGRSHVLPRFGPIPLGDIDHTMVATWIADLAASGMAPATVVKTAQILGKTLRGAVDADMIRTNPAARVKLPRIERQEMLFLTPPQVAALADAIDPRYRAFVLTGAYCGLRLGELAGLRANRVDLLRRRIEVAETLVEVSGTHHIGPPKTRAGRRSVPVPKVVAEALQAHLDTVSGVTVFPAPDGGLLRASTFRARIWTPACVATGVGELTKTERGRGHYVGLRIHDLRHTAVALWIAAGASPNEIARRAGHSSVVTVLDRYGHLLPDHEDAVTDALDVMAQAVMGQTGTVIPFGSCHDRAMAD